MYAKVVAKPRVGFVILKYYDIMTINIVKEN